MIDDPHASRAARERAIADLVNSLPPGRPLSTRQAALSGSFLGSRIVGGFSASIWNPPSGAMGGDR